MKLRTLTLLMASLGLASSLPAQLQINLDGLASKAKESVQITLDSTMLQMAGNFLRSSKSQDVTTKDLIAGLKAITVRNFQFAQEGQYRPEDLQPIRAQLGGWSKLVDTHSEHESSEIYTKTDQGKISGIAIINAAPKELSVVYIEGAIDLAGLARLGGNFGIPPVPIPGLKKPKKDKEKENEKQ